MTYEVWGEPDDGPELPDGWWNEDDVVGVQEAVTSLLNEPVYEGGEKDRGVSVRFLARLSVLKLRAQLADAHDPLIIEALAILGEKP